MKILVISHNERMQQVFDKISSKHDLSIIKDMDFSWDDIVKGDYEVIWSFHCMKKFPPEIIDKFRCINIHPGFNPFNRGYAPHVFSIIKGEPCGVTIHLIDEEFDHGSILYQEEVDVEPWHNSSDVYEMILDLEERLLLEGFDRYTEQEDSFEPENEMGSFNTKRDYRKLCHLDPNEEGTLIDHINLLRALTHEGRDNAVMTIDGKDIGIKIQMREL